MPESTDHNVVRGNLDTAVPNGEFTPNPDISGGSRLFFGGMGEGGPASPETGGLARDTGSGQSGSPANGQPGGNEPVYVTTPALEQQRQNGEAFTLVPPGTPVNEAEPSALFTWGGYFRALGVLLFFLVLLWLGLRLFRRVGKGRFMAAQTLDADELFLEAQLPLGQNRSVAVVRFQDRRLVLGVAEHQINLLTETYLDGTDPDADDALDNSDFQELMDSKRRGNGR